MSKSEKRDGEKDLAQTFEDHDAVQPPYIAKAPVCWFSFKEHPAWPINKDIDSFRELAICPDAFDWRAGKPRRKFAFFPWEIGIKVRVLLERDTCAVPIAAKVPKEFRNGWSRTEYLLCVNETTGHHSISRCLRRTMMFAGS